MVINHVTGYCIKFLKRLNDGLRLQLLGQKTGFLTGYTFKLVDKNFELGGQGPWWLSFLLLIFVIRVYVKRNCNWRKHR